MIQGSFGASTAPSIAIPQFTNNMFHDEVPQQFPVRQIPQVFFILLIILTRKLLTDPLHFLHRDLLVQAQVLIPRYHTLQITLFAGIL